MARPKKTYNVEATDASIKASIKRINAKIRGWKQLGDDVFEKKIENLQDATHFTTFDPVTGKEVRTNVNYNGKDYIPVTKENIDYFKKRIQDTDAANAAKTAKTGKVIDSKNILEQLEAYQTASEEINATIKDLKAGTIIGEDVDYVDKAALATTHPDMNKRELNKQVNALNKQYAIQELKARYTYDFKSDFHSVIDVLYEDKQANSDLIGRLQSEQWSGELMHAVDIRAQAWNLPDKEPKF